MKGLIRQLGTLHDRVTAAGFALAAALVALIAWAFCYEVVARYFFAAPTEWSYAVASYALAGVIFLAMPELTRRKAHIAITLLLGRIAAVHARRLYRAILIVAAAACLSTAWITGAEAWRQYVQEISTISAFPIPKWWISILVPYGMLGSGIYFLRHLQDPAPATFDTASLSS